MSYLLYPDMWEAAIHLILTDLLNGSDSLSRFNLFPSISVFGEQVDGYSSGEAINAIKEVAAQYLPAGFGYEFGGMSREKSSTGNM